MDFDLPTNHLPYTQAVIDAKNEAQLSREAYRARLEQQGAYTDYIAYCHSAQAMPIDACYVQYYDKESIQKYDYMVKAASMRPYKVPDPMMWEPVLVPALTKPRRSLLQMILDYINKHRKKAVHKMDESVAPACQDSTVPESPATSTTFNPPSA